MPKRKFTFGDYSRTSKYRIHSTRNDSSAESENNSDDEISSSSSDENDDSSTESDDDHSGNSSITDSSEEETKSDESDENDEQKMRNTVFNQTIVQQLYINSRSFLPLSVLLHRYFCSHCQQSEQVSYFLEISIIEQLGSMFKRLGFRELLKHRFMRNKRYESNYEDIYDGSIYKSLPQNFINNPNNITFTWNSDGIPIFNSSHISIWPYYLTVNELPFKERIKKENTVVAGLWFGTLKPVANLFLSAFENSFEQLYKGVDFEIPSEEDYIKVKGILISGTCDLPAKAQFLNIQQFNGKHGSPNCEIETVRLENVQTYPITESITLRTTEQSKLYAVEASEKGKPVYRIKGPTVLSLIMKNYIETSIIDSMHCVYQGMMKKLLTLWFSPEHCHHPSSLLPFISDINKIMRKITPPSLATRMPRKVSEFPNWKASELKTFLLIFSLSVLEPIMSKRYFEHHKLLVHAITVLNLEIVNDEMIETARRILTEYVSQFESLYGKKYVTLNVHLLLHLPGEVKKVGPL